MSLSEIHISQQNINQFSNYYYQPNKKPYINNILYYYIQPHLENLKKKNVKKEKTNFLNNNIKEQGLNKTYVPGCFNIIKRGNLPSISYEELFEI